MTKVRRVRLTGIATAALLLATASATVQRHGPDQAVFCSLGKSVDGHDIYCPRPVLNAGWPAPFLFDRPAVSVEDDISILEDDLRPEPFLANVAFYWLSVTVALRVIGLRRN